MDRTFCAVAICWQLALSVSQSASPSSCESMMKWWRQSALVLGISMWQPVSRRSSSVGEMVPV